MNTSHNPGRPDQKSINVSQDEAAKIADVVETRYDLVLSKAEATDLAKMVKELKWWQSESNEGPTAQRFFDELTADMPEIFQDLKEDGLNKSVSAPIEIVPFKEMHRLANEIRGMLMELRPVPIDPSVTEKAIKLLKMQYGVELTEMQLEQVIPFLYRKLWVEEGLDRSLGECLDDLLLNSKGESEDGANPHAAVRQALDFTVQKLTSKKA